MKRIRTNGYNVMRSIYRQSITVLAVAALTAVGIFSSCVEDICPNEQEPVYIDKEEPTGTLSFGATILGSKIVETRSILPEDSIEDKITGITVAAYSGGILADTRHYMSDFHDMKITVNKSERHNIYALVNMGDMTGEIPVNESCIVSLSHTVQSYADVENSGIPMCGMLRDVEYSTEMTELPVNRLFAKLRVRILHTGLNTSENNSLYVYNLCNKSIYVRQANSRIFPFSANGSKAISPSDTMDESDYNADLNSRTDYKGSLSNSQLGPGPGYFQDTTLVFYIPENMQGTLLPGNTDPYCKTSENISGINGNDYSCLCTYLEFTAKRENTGIGYGGSITYRYYLGSDNTTDFNIERNCRYDLTLNFSEGGFFVENWKVTKGEDWYDSRVLQFLEKPYVIYRGYTGKVMVHYNTSSSSAAHSAAKPDDWSYLFDEKALADAGLSYSFDRNTLVTGANGYKDFCFVFKASETAKAGTAVPLKIVSWDGSLSDCTTIYIAEPGNIEAAWDFCPMYVSQEGTVTITGIPESQMPLNVSFSNPSMVSCTPVTGNRFKVAATGTGNTVMTVSGKDGVHRIDINLNIQAPRLNAGTGYISANPDGEPVFIGYSYTDNTGGKLEHTNASIYNTLLRPAVQGNEFFGAQAADSGIGLYVKRLYGDDGAQIVTGASHELTIAAAGCVEVQPKNLSVYVIDPFADMTSQDYGKIDDYSLFESSSVNGKVSGFFKEEIQANSTFMYEAPVPNADLRYVSAEMVPRWLNVFSNANGAFTIGYETSTGYSSGSAFRITRNTSVSGTSHSAGRHDIMLNVTNRHSSESISKSAGTVDVYVHTAIGGTAEFAWRSGSYKPAGASQTFASVYRELMQAPNLSDNSNYIYYMDVKVEHLVDVSGVYVFSRMSSGVNSRQNIFDCLDIVRPSVKDKAIMQNSLLCSVFEDTGGTRITVGGEPYGYRRGIGKMLYRAILFPGKANSLTQTALKSLMLGYISTAQSNSGFAPQYNVHDMNIGSDMSTNIVIRNAPYHFSPSQCSGYRDKDGNGYHVIHFLEEIAPESNGWTNLL
ncbi:MAG: DUF4906 domain-containing protein [Bacteroidales bacterium]|nr:DUF4906 domain-containing protein [Bacteroidales bacterium]